MFEDLNINDWTYQRKMIQAEEDMKGLNKAPVIEIQEEPEEIKPLAEVIDFNEKKAEKEFNKFTPEQKFKLIALKTICKMSYEHLEGVLERGLSIDDIFKGVANRCFKNEKAIRR